MTPPQQILIAAALLVGTFLMLVAGIGLVRFPDVFCRMHAAGKAGTLGISLVILATVIVFLGSDQNVWLRGTMAIFFQFLTTPAATHLLAHACYLTDYPRTDLTEIDELGEYLPSRPDEATFGHE